MTNDNENIDWDVEEGWTECILGRSGTTDTTVSISPDGNEVHIFGVLYLDEQEQILQKMKELQLYYQNSKSEADLSCQDDHGYTRDDEDWFFDDKDD